MSNDDKDWDDIIEDEDNPYDNPDTSFDSEENAFEAGKRLAIENDGNAIDLDSEICYPSLADEDVINAFKEGYKAGGRIWFDREFGTGDDDEDMNKEFDEEDDFDAEEDEEDIRNRD